VKQPNPELARLRWRCRRGLLELDLLLAAFLENKYALLSPAQQQVFARLLDLSDDLLLALVQGKTTTDDIELKEIISNIV